MVTRRLYKSRSIGVTIIAILYFLGTAVLVVAWSTVIIDMVRDTTILARAIQALKSEPWPNLLKRFYLTTNTVASFFIAFGLFSLASWARQLAIFFILLEGIKEIARGVVQTLLAKGLPLDVIPTLLVLLFLLWFFNRDSVKEQFEEEEKHFVSPPSVLTPPPPEQKSPDAV